MPLDPWGLGGGIFDRIRDRVRNELGIQPGSPEEQGAGFLSRIKQVVRQQLGYDPGQPPPPPGTIPGQPPQQPPPGQPPTPTPQGPEYYGPPRSIAEIKARIQQAGRQKPPLMLRMLYNNQWRDVEPYSYRFRDADDPHIPLFYAWDVTKDNQIEAYKLKKIQDLQVTNRPFQERFVVEF